MLHETEKQKMDSKSSRLKEFVLLPEHLEDSGRHGYRCIPLGQHLQSKAESDCTADSSDAL